MRSRRLALTLVTVVCAASVPTAGAVPTTIAPEDLLPQAAKKNDQSTLLGIDALTDKELKQRFRKADRLERDYKALGKRAGEIKKRVETLEAQADDAEKLVGETEVRQQRAQAQVRRAQDAVNGATAEYVETVGSMSFGPAGASNPAPEDLLALAADSTSMGDATLVYSTAASLVNDRQKQLDRLTELSGVAARAATAARSEASAALDARRIAGDTLRDAVALQETLDDLKAATRSRAKSARAAAEDQLNRLLDAGAWVAPDADVDVGDRPLAQRLVSLSRAELAKGVTEVPMGSNNGEDISRYRSATQGAYAGAPWCAYFVSYIAARAGSPVGPTGAGMGAVVSIREWLTGKGQYFSAASSARPRPGDLVFWPQHIGIVVSYDKKTDQITTVEGNSSDRVNSRTTARTSVLGYGRLDEKVQSSGGGGHTADTPENSL